MFHLPYMAWRVSSSPRVDTRRCEGKPLRNFIDVSFLAGFGCDGRQPRERPYLYEAQTTCLVSGIDNYVWDGFGLVDTYLEENPEDRRDCKYFEDECQGQNDHHLCPDLIPAGAHIAQTPIWTPREYFLGVLGSRLVQVVKEWKNVVEWIERDILAYVGLRESIVVGAAHSEKPVNWASLVRWLTRASD